MAVAMRNARRRPRARRGRELRSRPRSAAVEHRRRSRASSASPTGRARASPAGHEVVAGDREPAVADVVEPAPRGRHGRRRARGGDGHRSGAVAGAARATARRLRSPPFSAARQRLGAHRRGGHGVALGGREARGGRASRAAASSPTSVAASAARPASASARRQVDRRAHAVRVHGEARPEQRARRARGARAGRAPRAAARAAAGAARRRAAAPVTVSTAPSATACAASSSVCGVGLEPEPGAVAHEPQQPRRVVAERARRAARAAPRAQVLLAPAGTRSARRPRGAGRSR